MKIVRRTVGNFLEKQSENNDEKGKCERAVEEVAKNIPNRPDIKRKGLKVGVGGELKGECQAHRLGARGADVLEEVMGPC